MKSLPRLAATGLLRLAVASTLVLFSTSARVPADEPKTLSNASMTHLVEQASKDELFHQVSEADAKRFLVKMYAGKSLSKEKWNELAEKKNRTAEETAAIFAHFGFPGLEDFGSYAEMLSAFGKKYGVDKMEESDQKRFFVAIREKEQSYIVDITCWKKYSQKPPPWEACRPNAGSACMISGIARMVQMATGTLPTRL